MPRLTISILFLLFASPLIAQENTPAENAAAQKLLEQSEQFAEQVVQVADNVYVAVGFSVSNVSMIVGNDGVVIVDTGMMLDDASRIAAAFREITDKAVKAIVFTHSHGDHTGGAAAFIGDERPQIWADKHFGSEARPLDAGGVTFQRVRGARQAGFRLPPEQRINNGIAPVRYPKRGGRVFASAQKLSPTHFLETERRRINVAGLDLDLVSSPGETNDQLFVWYPGGKVLFAGDNLFRLSPKIEADRMAKLAGGENNLRKAARDALAANDNQWAAQLADYLLAIDKNDLNAKAIKADALTNLARGMVNATARNYYLTVARELREPSDPN